MRDSQTQYLGYKISPHAHRLMDGSFSANLELTPSGSDSNESYTFYSLAYFASEADAVRHSRNWAREWIESRGDRIDGSSGLAWQ